MAVTLAASWLVASRQRGRREAGFWLFLVSNVLWVAWGLHTGAAALVVLQFCLAALNIRGASKAEKAGGAHTAGDGAEPKAAESAAAAQRDPVPTTQRH